LAAAPMPCRHRCLYHALHGGAARIGRVRTP
jgi:hypothetical protein